MRKTLLLSYIFLSACSLPGDISPEKLLQRSTKANRAVVSADVVINADIQSGTVGRVSATRIRASGQLADGGRQSSFAIHMENTLESGATPVSVSVDLDLLIAGEAEAYVAIRSVQSNQTHDLFSSPLFTQLLNTWIKIPSSPQSNEGMTPDPRILRMQTEIVKIVSDGGTEILRGIPMRKLHVTLDEEKLQAFMETLPSQEGGNPETLTYEGTLWIAEESFVLHRAEWRIQSKDASVRMDAHVTADITPRSDLRVISPPVPAIEIPFPPSLTGLDGLLFPQTGVMDDNAALPMLQDQLMESSDTNQ